MIRVNMFENPGPGIYGTADAMDIDHIILAALGFCAAAGAATYLFIYMLLA